MGNMVARRNGAVRPDRNPLQLRRTAQEGSQLPPVENVLPTIRDIREGSLLHEEPLRKGRVNPLDLDHRLQLFPHGEQMPAVVVTLLAAEVLRPVGGDRRDAGLFEQAADGLHQGSEIVLPDGDPHLCPKPVLPEDADRPDGPGERTSAANRVMHLLHPVHRNLDAVAAAGLLQHDGMSVLEKVAVAEQRKPHIVAADPFDQLRQIFPKQHLAAGKNHLEHLHLPEFGKDIEPLAGGQLLRSLTGAVPKIAVTAMQIASCSQRHFGIVWCRPHYPIVSDSAVPGSPTPAPAMRRPPLMT